MKTIKILGMGCPKCKQTEVVVHKAVKELGIDAEVIKVEDIQHIMQYNVLSTPALVIDEIVKSKGHVPTITEVKDALV
ncbi:MAG: thioredoxin family protein [Cyclobacteriaceae bacterium]